MPKTPAQKAAAKRNIQKAQITRGIRPHIPKPPKAPRAPRRPY